MRRFELASRVLLGFTLLCAGGVAGANSSVECGATLTRSTTLRADLACGVSALTIATEGVVLNCAGHAVRGSAPGGAGVLVLAADVKVVNCTFEGFSNGVDARGAPRLRVARNRFFNTNLAHSVLVHASPYVALTDNVIEESLGNIAIYDSPHAAVERNEFRPLGGHTPSVNLQRCPDSRVLGNRSTQGLSVSTWWASDDSVIANNRLGGTGRVSVAFSSRVEVRRNSAGGPGPERSGSLFAAELMGATDCVVAHNELVNGGIFIFGSSLYGPDGSPILIGADGNRVHDNTVEGAVYGLLIFGGSHNRIDRNQWSRSEMGVAVFPLIVGENLPVIPSTDNDVRRNLLDTGSYGVYTANVGGNRYEQNLIRGFGIGVSELGTVPFGPPDVIRGNVIADNDYFGLLALGASPSVSGNVFERNGGADQPPAVDLSPFGDLILAARGGIGLFPFDGFDPTTMDDGDPSNDVVPEPVIGLPDEPNVFEDNTFADIYALDTRAANAAVILTSNRFRTGGTAARVRQDWFGAIRVVPPDGGSAAGAIVEISDALGQRVATLTAGADGVAPEGCDPMRPMGRMADEVGGPTPEWLRITQYVVDRNGDRTDLTPHQVSVQAGGLSGQATYAWTGCADRECESLRRYQLADVTLGP